MSIKCATSVAYKHLQICYTHFYNDNSSNEFFFIVNLFDGVSYLNQSNSTIIADTRMFLLFTQQSIYDDFQVEYLSMRLKIAFVTIVGWEMTRVCSKCDSTHS